MRLTFPPQAGPSAIYAPPFDHPDIWTGNSTLMSELSAQLPSPPSAIICSVGGGGLLNGIAQGLDAWSPTPSSTTLLGVETAGAASLHAAVRARELVTLPRITSAATSLGCARVTQQTLDYALRPGVRTVVLPDGEAAMGCVRLADEERVMVELACGVSVALCFGGRLERALGRRVEPQETIVVVVCGGSNVTVDMLAGWRREFGDLEGGEEVVEREDEGVVEVEEREDRPSGRWEGVFMQAKI